MDPAIDLDRFVDAHRRQFADALAEIDGGRKRTHWMWFVFPQIEGLGGSSTAQFYAIRSLDEAVAFLAHPVLGADHRRIVHATWQQVVQSGVDISALMGWPDDRKLVSSLTLFRAAAERSDPPDMDLAREATELLDAAIAQGHPPCEPTERFVVAAE